MKNCTVCKELKSFEEFYNSRNHPDGKSYRCKTCDALARKAYEQRHKEKRLSNIRRANRKYKYGLSEDKYQQLIHDQNGCCAICSVVLEQTGNIQHKANTLCIDHDHKTGVVRGLLCSNCNRALGLFKDNVKFITNAIQYLEKKTYGICMEKEDV